MSRPKRLRPLKFKATAWVHSGDGDDEPVELVITAKTKERAEVLVKQWLSDAGSPPAMLDDFTLTQVSTKKKLKEVV